MTSWVEFNPGTFDYVVYRGEAPRPAVYVGRCDKEADAILLAHGSEMVDTIKDLTDILEDYIQYAQEMRKIGRGFSTVDTAGRVDVNVLAGAKALLVARLYKA